MFGICSVRILFLLCVVVPVVWVASSQNLIRKRRHWILPPTPLKENNDYTHLEYIARIRSDFDTGSNVVYSLEGIGANMDPFHTFVVDAKSGKIRVTKILDREFIDSYNLSGVARYLDGTLAERNIDIRVKVLDENDNAPVFGKIPDAEVLELSATGNSVAKISAVDMDEPGNVNSKIAYSIIEQNPDQDMFSISPDGTIYVKKSSLDRETQDQYTVIVKGQDLNGQPGGKSGTGTVTINVNDVNDNPPTLEKELYEGSIEENVHGVEVMRLQANDLDLKGTENYEAVFDIVKGNEAGYFSIKTDPKTNEGILMLDKAVDYEDVKNLDLGITVRNKAPLVDGSGTFSGANVNLGGGGGGGVGGSGSAGTSGTGGASGGSVSGGHGTSTSQSGTYKTYPVKISVKNQPEGPQFNPAVKAIPISEGGDTVSINTILTRYTAIDADTQKPAENVRYIKGSDPANWLTIDPKTADIKLTKMPDRESPALVNGTYFAQILCISEDMPGKTATGTIAIQVEDFNDHCPRLTSNIKTLCTTESAVIVNAKDEDADPNGAPFDYEVIPKGTEGKWHVEHLNDTAAILRSEDSVWPGLYQVEFMVKDQQGLACPEPQKVTVQVCTCEDGETCGKRGSNGQPSKEAQLGPAGIGLLCLGLLLLLLIPLLLLFCQCGGAVFRDRFTEMPFDTKSHLINYHTERQGENTEVPLLNMPTHLDGNAVQKETVKNVSAAGDFQQSVSMFNGMNSGGYQGGFSNGYQDQTWEMKQLGVGGFNSEYGSRQAMQGEGIFDGMALPEDFLGEYYSQVTSGNDNLGVKDELLMYDYEGKDSSAGSVGCCSLLEIDDDLHFLDDLGVKFKTLAEVCGGKKIQNEAKPVLPPLPSVPSSSAQTLASTLVSPQQMPPPPLQQSRTQETVIRETSNVREKVERNAATVREGTTVTTQLANQNQMILLPQQQPIYYTTAPMLQPVHYVVQPQVQSTVLLAEAPATNVHNMVLVQDAQAVPSQGVIVQAPTTISSGHAQGHGMVLVGTGEVPGVNVVNKGNYSGHQTMMVVEGKVPAGSTKVLKGNQTHFVPGGTLQHGGMSGSQTLLLVGEQTGSGGRLLREAGGLSQRSEVSGLQGNTGSTESKLSGSQSRKTSSTTRFSTGPSHGKVVVEKFSKQ